MKLKLWQVDAFAERAFRGNPAAVVPLEQWLPETTMQMIASENNLAETAFFVPRERGCYDLRWFTPTVEVPLCGHATLASAWVIFGELEHPFEVVRFTTKSGVLTVEKGAGGRHSMALPAGAAEPFTGLAELGRRLGQVLDVPAPRELHSAPQGAGGRQGIVGVWGKAEIRAMRPSGHLGEALLSVGASGLLATAQGDGAPYDFVSRFFAPRMGVTEDPVTGSMHATLTPFWAKRLGKKSLRAYQASPRGGDLLCTDEGYKVVLSGPCALYLRGEIDL